LATGATIVPSILWGIYSGGGTNQKISSSRIIDANLDAQEKEIIFGVGIHTT